MASTGISDHAVPVQQQGFPAYETLEQFVRASLNNSDTMAVAAVAGGIKVFSKINDHLGVMRNGDFVEFTRYYQPDPHGETSVPTHSNFKIHLTVVEHQIPQALEIIGNHLSSVEAVAGFKVASLSHASSFYQDTGTQKGKIFTIYLSDPLVLPDVEAALNTLQQKLVSANIEPGPKPPGEPDIGGESPYMTYRNSRRARGEQPKEDPLEGIALAKSAITPPLQSQPFPNVEPTSIQKTNTLPDQQEPEIIIGIAKSMGDLLPEYLRSQAAEHVNTRISDIHQTINDLQKMQLAVSDAEKVISTNPTTISALRNVASTVCINSLPPSPTDSRDYALATQHNLGQYLNIYTTPDVSGLTSGTLLSMKQEGFLTPLRISSDSQHYTVGFTVPDHEQGFKALQSLAGRGSIALADADIREINGKTCVVFKAEALTKITTDLETRVTKISSRANEMQTNLGAAEFGLPELQSRVVNLQAHLSTLQEVGSLEELQSLRGNLAALMIKVQAPEERLADIRQKLADGHEVIMGQNTMMRLGIGHALKESACQNGDITGAGLSERLNPPPAIQKFSPTARTV